MVDLEGTATDPIPAETADAIGGVKNGVYYFSPDRCPVDPFLDESYVGLTVIRLERLIRQGAESTDRMPMCSDSCDQIRVESETEERSVGSDIHAAAEPSSALKTSFPGLKCGAFPNYPTCG